MNYFNLVALLLDAIVLLTLCFSFWQDLQEDYPADGIFSLTLLIFFISLFFGRLAFILGTDLPIFQRAEAWLALISLPGISLPVTFLTGLLVLQWFVRKNQWNAWQVGDSLIFQFLKAVFFFSLISLLSKFSWNGVCLAVLAVVVYLLGLRLTKSYRSLRWYKSGKVGFLATSLTFAFFSLFLLLAIFVPLALYWETLLSLGLALLSLVLLYRRSERTFRQDFKIFFKNGRH